MLPSRCGRARGAWAVVLASLTLAVGCSSSDPPRTGGQPASSGARTEPSSAPADTPPLAAEVSITVDASTAGEEISPFILGVSGDLDPSQMREAGIRLDSWGGNPASRFNFQIGHAWNAAADWEFRNTNYGWSEDAFRAFLETNAAAGVATRLAVPTLGWIARDDDQDNCSFEDDEGGCTGGAGANCEEPGPIADPQRTSIESTPPMVAEWVATLIAEGGDIQFIAMDNEPDLWGHTHYDVHPACPTYEEILDRYLTYARAVREVAPAAELMGPVMCCWYDYWRIAPGPVDGSGDDFLGWFLRGVRTHDETYGRRTLDIVDVHFYPQSEVFNEDTDDETNARRLRSTRALWDPTYVDESWIGEPIEFIPRIKRTIAESYPDTPLGISEWNFGSDTTMNGALAIADALGIYGREGVYLAAYWRSPPAGSPGYYAFQMHGNYDGAGTRFAGRVVSAVSSDASAISSYAALDGEVLRLMLVNKLVDDAVPVSLTVEGHESGPTRRFTYGPADLGHIVTDSAALSDPLVLAPSSITVLELGAAS